MIHSVKVEKMTDNPLDWTSKIYLDDVRVNNITSLDFRLAVDEIPQATITTYGFPELDGKYDVKFEFTPETVEEAIKVLRNTKYEVLEHDEDSRIVGFLKSEIADCQNRYKDMDSCNPAYDGENVGNEITRALNDKHILFCKRLLDMILSGGM